MGAACCKEQDDFTPKQQHLFVAGIPAEAPRPDAIKQEPNRRPSPVIKTDEEDPEAKKALQQ